jgi:hypothetical protein
MTAPTTLRFGAGIFYVETTADSGTFTKVCGFTSAKLSMSTDTADTTVPDCDAPDAAAWVARDAVSQSWEMSFEGVLAKEATSLLESKWTAGASCNVRLHMVGLGSGGATPDRRYSGAAFITLGASGERGQRWTRSVTVQGDGALTIADVAALA